MFENVKKIFFEKYCIAILCQQNFDDFIENDVFENFSII